MNFGYVLSLKTQPAGVQTAPHGIVIKKKVFSHKPRKYPNPRPIHTQGDVNLFTCALVWGERGDFLPSA